MNEIVAVVNEMKTITSELKRLRLETQKLNKRKKEIEEQILNYLKEKDEPGFKFQGMAVIAEEKDIRAPRKKVEKINNGVALLEKYGVPNPEKILDELMDKMKGSPCTEMKLKIRESNEKDKNEKKERKKKK